MESQLTGVVTKFNRDPRCSETGYAPGPQGVPRPFQKGNKKNVTATRIASGSRSIIQNIKRVEGRGNSLFSVVQFLLTFESTVAS